MGKTPKGNKKEKPAAHASGASAAVAAAEAQAPSRSAPAVGSGPPSASPIHSHDHPKPLSLQTTAGEGSAPPAVAVLQIPAEAEAVPSAATVSSLATPSATQQQQQLQHFELPVALRPMAYSSAPSANLKALVGKGADVQADTKHREPQPLAGPSAAEKQIREHVEEVQKLLADFARADELRKQLKSDGVKKFTAAASQFESARALKSAADAEVEIADALDSVAKSIADLADAARKRATKNKKRQKTLLRALEKGSKPQFGFADSGDVDLKELLPLRTHLTTYEKLTNAIKDQVFRDQLSAK